MSYALAAAKRTAIGRRSHTLMDTGSIPAVLYGRGVESVPIQLQRGEFRKVYRDAGTSSLIDLALDGATPVKVIVKDVQVHPLTLDPVHVDLHQIRMDEEMTANVPLRFMGDSKAVKEFAGTLVHSLNALRVKCLPANLPSAIDVDISSLETFDDAITIGSLNLPPGVTVLEDPGTTIATVAPPLTDEQLKKLEEAVPTDVTAIKTEAEVKKAEDEAKKAEEAAAAAAAPGAAK